MTIMGHTGTWPRRLLRLWQRWDAVALEVTATLYHADDVGESTGTREFALPSWPWRLVCWIQGHRDSSYGECVICKRSL